MPGRPRWKISLRSLAVTWRLIQTKPFFGVEPLAQFVRVDVGQHGGDEFDRLVLVDDVARLGEHRHGLDVGGEDGAVAVEQIGPRARRRPDRRRPSASAAARATGRDGRAWRRWRDRRAPSASINWRMRPTPLSSRVENSAEALRSSRRARSAGLAWPGLERLRRVMASPRRRRGAGGAVGRRGAEARGRVIRAGGRCESPCALLSGMSSGRAIWLSASGCICKQLCRRAPARGRAAPDAHIRRAAR